MVDIRDLVIKRSDNGVLRFTLEINFNFQKAKKYLIYGDNGSGKSTLLEAIEGSIYYDGEIIFDSLEEGELSKSIFSFNLVRLPEHLRVKEYLELLDFKKDQATKFLSLMVLSSKRNAFIKELEPDQKDRLKIASLVTNTYKVILIDEITRGIPIEAAKDIIGFLLNNTGGATLLIADHHIRDLSNRFDETIFIEKGKIKETFKNDSLEVMESISFDVPARSQKRHIMLTLKHRAKVYAPLYLAFVALIVVLNLLSFSANYITYAQPDGTLSSIGVQAQPHQTIDLSNSKHESKGLFYEDYYKLFADKDTILGRVYSVTEGSNNEDDLFLATEFDLHGTVILSGRRPELYNEIAISKNLRKHVKNGQIEMSLNTTSFNNISGVAYNYKVTGYIRGIDRILPSYTYLNSISFDLRKDIDELDFNIVGHIKDNVRLLPTTTYNKVRILAPNKEYLQERLDLDNILIQYKGNEQSYKLPRPEEDSIIYHNSEDIHEITVFVPFNYVCEYLTSLEEEKQVQLFYSNRKDYLNDLKEFKSRGYRVFYGKAESKMGAALYIQFIVLASYLSLMMLTYVVYLKKIDKLESLPSKISVRLLDRIIALVSYLTLSLIPLIVICIFLGNIFWPVFFTILTIVLSIGIGGACEFYRKKKVLHHD